MDVTREQVGDVTVVVVQADYIDGSNSPDFKRLVAGVIERKVILDLSRVQLIDSSGCGAIISYLRLLKSSGGDLKLCSVTRTVRALFELVRMHKMFDIFNTRDEAVRAFGL